MIAKRITMNEIVELIERTYNITGVTFVRSDSSGAVYSICETPEYVEGIEKAGDIK